MPHYKTPDNALYFLDSAAFEHLLPAGCTPITDAQADALRPVPPPPPIQPISPRQIRQALTLAGLRASVEAAVAASDQDTKDWYEFATAFEREHPKVIAMGTALGVSAQALDGLWATGAAL